MVDLISMSSSQKHLLLKHRQRQDAKQGRRQLQIHADLSASQSTIKSSPSTNVIVTLPAKRGGNMIQHRLSGDEEEEGSEANTLMLHSNTKKGKDSRRVQLQPSQQDMDMSLGQLINDSSMSMVVTPSMGAQATAKPNILKPASKAVVKKQEELMTSMSQKGLKHVAPSSQARGGTVSMDDAYSQLKGLKFDLQKIRQVHRDLADDDSSGEDEASSEESERPPQMAPAYAKLVKPKSKDQPNVQSSEGVKAEQGMSVFEINNKLIAEAYAVSKRREYVQRHIGEVDMDILDAGNESAAPLQAFSKAMQYIKKPQRAPLNHANQDEEEDDSRSQNDGDHEFSGINIQMLTDDKRLSVQIPSYDAHYRLYFENPEAFRQQQQVAGQISKPTHATKIYEERQEALEQTCRAYFSRLSDSDALDQIGRFVPSFGTSLRDLQNLRLKYWLLLDRVKKVAPVPVKNAIISDKNCELAGVSKDFKQSYVSSQLQPQLSLQPGRDNQQQMQQQRRKGTFGDPNLTSNSLQQAIPQQLKKDESQRAGTSSMHHGGGEVQRIKDQLGDAESKLKDAQLQRLQEKVKGFAATEKQLRMQVMEVEKRDESLVTKIENAVCFGKVVITSRPLIVHEFGDLLSEIKYHGLDVHLQRKQQLNEKLEENGQEQTLAERVDDAIGVKLEVEFNELYNILRSPATLKEAGFTSRFGLVTPESHFHLYSDMYMTQEVAFINLAHADFCDMGILLQNNKESKRMTFFKVVHHNLRERRREVYLMSVFEDQVTKWESCLEPTDEIKSHDRTYKIIKDKLLRAMIERDRALHQRQHHQLDQAPSLDNLDYDNWESAVLPLQQQQVDREEDFPRLKDPSRGKQRNSLLASSDEDEYSVYQKRHEDHVSVQRRKLMDVGIEGDDGQGLDHVAGQNERYIGRTEDLQRELVNINQNVQLRVKSKMAAEQEKEDKERQSEQQRRQRVKEVQNQEYAMATKSLTLGTTFLKYGAMGPPKQRHVFLQENGKKICWKDPGATSTSGSRSILVKEILKLEEGRDTKKFKRFKTDSEAQEALSFSIHTKKRTLDLEAANLSDKVSFVNSLQVILRQNNQLESRKTGVSSSSILDNTKDELNESS